MVADQPLDAVTPGLRGRATRSTRSTAALGALAAEYAEQGRGFELRNVAGGWRFYTREEYAAVVEGVRARRPAGPAHPGRPRDAGGGRLQAAGLAGPGLRDPRRQRRRRDAHAADPRAGRGGRPGRARPAPTSTAPPATSSSGSASPRSTTCPSWRRTCPTWTTSRTSWSGWRAARPRRADPAAGAGSRAASTEPRTAARHRARRRDGRAGVIVDRRRRADPAAEAARPVRGRLPPQVRGADARRPGRGRRRGRHPARHQGRPHAPR